MTKFCGTCGAPLDGTGAFCGKCGANTGLTPATPSVPQSQSSKPNLVLKVVLSVIVLLVLGGFLLVGGLFYAAHRVGQRIHELASDSSSAPGGMPSARLLEDPCGLLTKTEVSQAIGITITGTKSRGFGCTYIARGDPAEMVSRHLAIMRGSTEISAGRNPSNAADQDVEVFSYSVTAGTLENALAGKLMNNLSHEAQPLSGVGDQAMVVGGGMMVVRKGDRMLRIVYMQCPCNTDAVKPLAQKLVSAI